MTFNDSIAHPNMCGFPFRGPLFFRGALPYLLLCVLFSPALAQGQTTQADLKRLSLEELVDLQITLVARRPEPLRTTPSAVHVITQDDIRRSGAVSIPQALRLAPNLHVAQRSARDWAVSARGFNSTVANKLLVMIDGRTVYTPLFSGVFWDAQDTLLEDIDRIEVVSGPGGTLWGANAVNGVINIVTKSASDPRTHGMFIQGGGGFEERGFGGVRYGGQAGENVFYRVYGKYFNRDSSRFADGRDGQDAWQMGQGGFRVDWHPSEKNRFTFQGDGYAGAAEPVNPGRTALNGNNLLARWNQTVSADADWSLQLYYDRTHRHIPGTITDDLDTYDVDFQHRFPWGDRHELTWGLGYRFTDNHVRNTAALAFLPSRLTRNLFSGFIQDRIMLAEDRVYLTLGTKLEHNDYTGVEVQPSGRLLWNATERQSVWAAISRAVRTPSRIDRHFFVPDQPPFLLAGGPDFDSESLIAYELGYRAIPHPRLTTSAAAFYNVYDGLRSLEPGPPPVIDNGLEGESYGVELQASWQAMEWWRLMASYTAFKKHLRAKSWSGDTSRGRAEGADPNHRLLLRSSMDLPGNVELDGMLRYVSRLDTVDAAGYVEVDARIGWRPRENVELSLVGRNLIHRRQAEFGTPGPRRHEIERSVFAQAVLRF